MRINLVRISPSGINWSMIRNDVLVHGSLTAEFDGNGCCDRFLVDGYSIVVKPTIYPFRSIDDFFNTADVLKPVFTRLSGHVFKQKWFHINPMMAFQFPGFGRNLNFAEKFFMRDYIIQCGSRGAVLCENDVSITNDLFMQMQKIEMRNLS